MNTTQATGSVSTPGVPPSSTDYEYYVYEYDIEDAMKLPLKESLPVTFTYSLTLLLGLVGNVLVIFSIAYYRRMRTTTNVFLLSLATADLLLVLICVPIKAAAFLSYTWNFGEACCLIVNYVQSVSMICSVMTLTCISLERAIAVVLPLKARTICTMRHAKIVVLCVWSLSFLLAVPSIFAMNYKEVGVHIKAYWCIREIEDRLFFILYEMYMFVLLFVIPIGVMISTYVIICVRVWTFADMRADMRHGRVIAPTSKERPRPEISGADNVLLSSSFNEDPRQPRVNRKKTVPADDSKTTKQLVLMLVMVVILFAICWGPILINNLLVAFGYLHVLHYEYLKPMRITFHLMSYFNSCVNPIVYAFMSKNFRQSFKFAICACVKGQAFVRAYRFSMSVASTRTSAVSNGRQRPGSAVNKEKSSSSGNDATHTHAPIPQDDEIVELRSMPNKN